MDAFIEILLISAIGMAVTMALLSVFAGLFYAIGKLERKEERLEELLPFIAAAVFLYYRSRSK